MLTEGQTPVSAGSRRHLLIAVAIYLFADTGCHAVGVPRGVEYVLAGATVPALVFLEIAFVFGAVRLHRDAWALARSQRLAKLSAAALGGIVMFAGCINALLALGITLVALGGRW